MKAVVLNGPLDLGIQDVPDAGEPGPGEVRVRVGAVGICGSDVHYYEHGRIGDFVLRGPMTLGHEAAGVVEQVGPGVEALRPGDAVAMEPGVPCGACRTCRAGRYNLCAEVRFWATPPYDGALAEYVVHPSSLTYRLPDGMSLEEGALMEPMSVGVHACNRGGVIAGSVVAISGAGTIGTVTLMAALACGAAQAIVADVIPARLERATSLGASAVVDARRESLSEAVMSSTGGRGADVGVECSGHPSGVQSLVDAASAGGRVVVVGMGPQPTKVDFVSAMVKEVDVMTVFRYANAYPTAIELASGGRCAVGQLVTDRFSFGDSVSAFEYARSPRPETCKVMIEV